MIARATTARVEIVTTPTGDPVLDDERITAMGLLAEAHAALDRAVLPRVDAAGLSLQQFELLLRLARTPGHRLRMSELASAMTSITPSGLTRLVDRLEQRGLVVRERCPEDRRGAFAVLSPEGLAQVRTLLPGHAADVEAHLTGLLSDEERATLLELLRRVRDAGGA